MSSSSPETASRPVNGSSDGYASDSDAGSCDLLVKDSQLPEHFNRLSKLRREGEFCDVQVRVSGRDFMAHRCILGAASPHFLRMFLAEPNCGHFTLPRGYSPDAFALLLEFAYTGRLMVPDRLLPQACSLARLLAMRPVLDACTGRLLQACLVPRTALELRAQLSDCQPLLDRIDAYITANLAEVLSHDTASLPKIMIDLLVSGGGAGAGLNQLCDLLADWLARSVHNSSSLAAASSSSTSSGGGGGGGSPTDAKTLSSDCDAGINGGGGGGSGGGGFGVGDAIAMVDLDCLERMSSQPHLLYLSPGGVLIDCDDLPAAHCGGGGGGGPDGDLAKLVPQIRDYIDSKRLQARILSSRHRGPSPLARSVLGILTPAASGSNADCSATGRPDLAEANCERTAAAAAAAAAQCLVQVGSALALLSIQLQPVLPTDDAVAGIGANPGGFQRQLSAQSSGSGVGVQRQLSGQSGSGLGTNSESEFAAGSYVSDSTLSSAGSPTPSSSLAASSDYANFAAMSTPRSAFGFVGIGGNSDDDFYLLACGGYNRGQCLNSSEILRPGWNAGCWSPAPPLLTGRSRCSAAVLSSVDNYRVYVCGGSDGVSELNTVEVFDGQQWLPGPPMLQARSGCCTVAMDGVLYCLGGRYGADSLRQAELLDPRIGRWQPLPPMLSSRNECAAAANAGRIWVAGGADNWGGQCLASVEVYEPRVASWIRVPRQLSQPRRGAAVAELAGKFWLVGGSDGQRPALSACEPIPAVLDDDEADAPALNNIGGGEPAMRLASPRANLGLAALPASLSAGLTRSPSCLLAVGGFSGKVFLDCCELLHL